MKIHNAILSFENTRKTVVTIGTFDGVHKGHKQLLNRIVSISENQDLESVLITFFPHPRMVLQPGSNLKMINTINEKAALLEQAGLDHLIIHPFSKDFSRVTAIEFVRDMLVKKLNIKAVVIGYDHRFGRNRDADINDMKAFGNAYKFDVIEIQKQELEDIAISSTKVRNAILEGNIETANALLGYSFFISGIVVKGRQIGRTIGYPTANLQLSETYKILPKNGVYVVQATIENELVRGMMNIGTNPTVGGTTQTIETYFLDKDFDLYDQSIQIDILARIRDEENFDSLESLKIAMKHDEDFSRSFKA